MKISIIIPVYNVAPYIEECIQSVMNQTYRNLEVLIVDDCGADDSMEIISNMFKGREEVSFNGILFRIIHHEQNKGLSEARNTGLKFATGEYIYFLDSDDYLFDNSIECMVDQAQKTNADIIEARIESGVTDQRNYIFGLTTDKKTIMDIFYSRMMHIEVYARLVKRALISDNHLSFYKDLISEDVPWSFQIFCCANSVFFMSEKLYYYRRRPDSIMTSKNFSKRLVCFPIILSLCVEIAKKYHKERESGFKNWIEFYKALFFQDTKTLGTPSQLTWYYNNGIRSIYPLLGSSKDRWHYFFPSFIGIHVYQRFYGRLFC